MFLNFHNIHNKIYLLIINTSPNRCLSNDLEHWSPPFLSQRTVQRLTILPQPVGVVVVVELPQAPEDDPQKR